MCDNVCDVCMSVHVHVSSPNLCGSVAFFKFACQDWLGSAGLFV